MQKNAIKRKIYTICAERRGLLFHFAFFEHDMFADTGVIFAHGEFFGVLAGVAFYDVKITCASCADHFEKLCAFASCNDFIPFDLV